MTDAADFTVEVRDRDFDRLGQIAPEYLNLKFVDVFNGVGSWELKLPAEHPLLPALKTKGSGLIVTEHWLEGSTHFYRVYSGRMRSASLSQDAADPKGTWVVTGVHDNVLAAATRVYPDPASPADAQDASHWTTAGPGETVMKQAVQLNAGSAAIAGRSYPWLTVAPDQVRGQSVKTSSRLDVLGDLLTSLGTAAGLGWQFAQQGDGLQFEVYEPADKTGEVRLDIRNGGVQSNELGFTAPSATEVLVMGQGQGEDRTILQVTSPEAQQEAEDWGIRWEVTKDQRQTDDPDELLQAGQELITEQGATVNSLKVTPSDAPNMRLGRDWYRGDRITVVVEGQETTALVTQVATSITSAGVIRQATVGDPVGFDFDAKVASKVRDHEKRIGQVERLVGQGSAWSDVVDKPVGAFADAGDVKLTARATPPAGWLLADGASYLRADYPGLFAAIGTTYGAADATHFNVPDLRGRTAIGAGTGDAGTATAHPLGQEGGQETVALTAAQNGPHRHMLTDGGHGHSFSWGGAGGTTVYLQNAIAAAGAPPSNNATTYQNAWNQTSIAGSGEAHNNMQPFLALNYIIKT